jgi:hypothetical protein
LKIEDLRIGHAVKPLDFATEGFHFSIFQWSDSDPRGFTAAEAQAVIAQTNFDGIAQRSEAEYPDLFSFEESHLEKSLDDEVVALDIFDASTLADP